MENAKLIELTSVKAYFMKMTIKIGLAQSARSFFLL
ncbi:MAG: hypothetical protein RL403_1028 [Bacteroidota bacterium]|jgi:hypothetical protein